MKFLPYEPDQAWLLPPSVKDVQGEEHLCFFIHQVVERLNLSAFAAEYSEEGQRPYAPALMVKVWLYAYCLQVTSSRRLMKTPLRATLSPKGVCVTTQGQREQ